MPNVEKRIVMWVEQHVSVLYFIIISILGFAIRYSGRGFLSGDMTVSLIPWFDAIRNEGGIRALAIQVGDYNILYQTLISIMTYLPFEPVIMYKGLSAVFDYMIALLAAVIVSENLDKPKFGAMFNCVYTVVLFLPTVVLNSSYWGQCDSMYTCMILLVFRSLLREKYKSAFIWLGVAFALKFQTVFIIPFVIVYYIVSKKFSIIYFGISIVVFWAFGIPAYVYGRGLLTPFQIYEAQTGSYTQMILNSRTFWRIFSNDYDTYKGFAILLTCVLCGIGCYIVMTQKIKMKTAGEFFKVAVWFVWVCCFFLPSMHDRYAYLLDILLILVAFFDKRYIIISVISVVFSLMTYAYFLNNAFAELNMWHALIELIAFVAFSYMTFKEKTASYIESGEKIKEKI